MTDWITRKMPECEAVSARMGTRALTEAEAWAIVAAANEAGA